MAKVKGSRKPTIEDMIAEMAEWQRRAEADFVSKMGPPTSEVLDAVIDYPSGRSAISSSHGQRPAPKLPISAPVPVRRRRPLRSGKV